MPITLLDISQRTKFSVSTVSRVLHDEEKKYKISDATSDIIRKAAEELGYRPNELARGLRLRRTKAIGIVVPDVSAAFFSSIIKTVEREVRLKGYSLIVCDTDEKTEIEKEAILTLLSKKVDGLIVAPVGLESDHLKSLVEKQIPLVTVDRCFSDLDTDSVALENAKGAFLAVSYLIREGHQKIGLIQGLRGTSVNAERLKGYRQAIDEAKIPYEQKYVVGDYFRSLNGYVDTKMLLELSDPPTAIFTASGLTILGVLEALKEGGVAIPRDISLVTFDDPEYAPFLVPALSAVEQPIQKMGEASVHLLFRRIESPQTMHVKITLEPQLKIRESVARRERLFQKGSM